MTTPYNTVTPSAGSALQALSLQAATPVGGFALVNGTPVILSWTPPNDGKVHRFMVIGHIIATGVPAGGQINANFTCPDGTGANRDLVSGYGAGFVDWFTHGLWCCQAGQPVQVQEQSALTAGAAQIWAEIWGS